MKIYKTDTFVVLALNHMQYDKMYPIMKMHTYIIFDLITRG